MMDSDKAEVEVRYGVSANPAMGGIAGRAPVPINARSNLIRRTSPSVVVTSSALAVTNCAVPWIRVMAGLSRRILAYLASRSASTNPCCCSSNLPRSTVGAQTSMPSSKGLWRRKCAIFAARIMVFDGTHPVFTQVPPRVARSITVIRAPRSAAFSAAAMAAPPVPMTAM